MELTQFHSSVSLGGPTVVCLQTQEGPPCLGSHLGGYLYNCRGSALFVFPPPLLQYRLTLIENVASSNLISLGKFPVHPRRVVVPLQLLSQMF